MNVYPTEVLEAELKLFALLPVNRDDLDGLDANMFTETLLALFEAGQEEAEETGYAEGRNAAYDDAYDEGLYDGRREGRDEGFEEGEESGYNEGHKHGYTAGYDDALLVLARMAEGETEEEAKDGFQQ